VTQGRISGYNVAVGVTASGFTRCHFIHQTEGSASYIWRLPATGQVVSAQMRYLLRHTKTETGKLYVPVTVHRE